jgi:predicted phosphodiesterase
VIALISDIHGHLDRLQRVLEEIDARGISRIWCLGDIIGVGGQSRACWQLVRERCEVVIAGNHDLGVSGRARIESFPEWAVGAINESANYLLGDEEFCNLPAQRVVYCYDQPVRVVHGAPGDPVWGFIDGAGDAYFAFQRVDEKLIVHGHTHKQAWCQGANFHSSPPAGEIVQIDRQTIINPGAVMRGDWAILHLGGGAPSRAEFCHVDV